MKTNTLLRLCAVLLVALGLRAQDANVIPFQGQLANQAGQPLSPTNAVTLVIRLYNAPVGGMAIWEESQPGVSVNAGRFSVLLGSRTMLPAQSYFNSTLYLGITVDDGIPATADMEMRPRQAIVPVISARYAQNADKLRGYDWSALFGTNNPVDGKIQGSKIADGAIQGQHFGVPLAVPGDLSINGNASVGIEKQFVAHYTSDDRWSGSLGWSWVHLGNNGANYIVAGRSSPGGSLRFVTDNTNDFNNRAPHNGKEVMTLTESGNVGIGINSPQAKLDVSGTVKAASFSGDGIVPVGSIMPFGGTVEPSGWVFCDGRVVSRTGTYSNLFSIIGTAWGVGDGISTFYIPDLRGNFLRGVDTVGATDPDRASRTNRSGQVVGPVVGSLQADAFKSHTHTYQISNPNAGAGGGAGQAGTPLVTQNAGVAGGNETRPKNAYVNYIIKY